MWMGLSGFAKRVSRCAACFETGETARRFRGRELRRSEEVGIDSGMFSDMLAWFCGRCAMRGGSVCVCYRLVAKGVEY